MRVSRIGATALVICAILSSLPTGWGANKKKDKDPPKPTYNDLADEIFKKADLHSHGYLNKIEFKKADAILAASIQDMVQQGTIGKKQGKGKTPTSPPQFTPGFATADADHDNKVMQTEFTTYVNHAVEAADQFYQYDAAQKKK